MTTDPTLPGSQAIRLRGGVGPAPCSQWALRRVGDGVIVVGERWPADATPSEIDGLVARLEDPEVAVSGLGGARSGDLRRSPPVARPIRRWERWVGRG